MASLPACRKSGTVVASDAGEPVGSAAELAPPPPSGPKLGITAVQVDIFERPSRGARKIGYLRLGAQVPRSEGSAGQDGCPGGWYKIHPRGYVCVGDEATLDLNHPIVRAASVRPDLSKPLPYAYGFVRAVAPLYLKVPSREEQLKSEFALERHLAWWEKEGATANKVVLGANDLPLDANGNVAVNGPPVARRSIDMSEGELFGGKSDKDPVPFWLQGSRQIPNLSTFKVPNYAVFANRVRRHTGLAFVGSFDAGPGSFDRRFAVTPDLMLVPATKVKPDTASPFHGIEVTADMPLPFAWARLKEAYVYRLEAGKLVKTDQRIARRAIVRLTGKTMKVDDTTYREADGGRWVKASDMGAALAPTEWPQAANAGEKWIDISIENQTLVLWEGKKPVYATLVSTGQDGMGDWKTTKSTIRGVFRIKNKHVTATMDSNGRSAEGGGPAPAVGAASDKGGEKDSKGGDGRDPQEGKTVRRGQGTFELRDVPWVQYFEAGFALHTAYWHDVFGVARSHGCVNLTPVDAHRIFMWTEPAVPANWHGVIAGPDTAAGTTVSIHR